MAQKKKETTERQLDIAATMKVERRIFIVILSIVSLTILLVGLSLVSRAEEMRWVKEGLVTMNNNLNPELCPLFGKKLDNYNRLSDTTFSCVNVDTNKIVEIDLNDNEYLLKTIWFGKNFNKVVKKISELEQQ